MATGSLEYSNHIEEANHKPRFNIKQGMLAWHLKESYIAEQMRNSEKTKLKLILECIINRQYVHMASFNATKKGSSTYFLDENHYGF